MNDDFLNKLVMIPYELGGRSEQGLDCWGLVVLAHRELLGIEVPTYDQTVWSVSNSGITSEDIRSHLESSAPFVEVFDPKYGDFVLLSILGHPVHIGFMLDSKTMIHTSEKTGVVCENIGSIKWKKRIEGFYRHLDLI